MARHNDTVTPFYVRQRTGATYQVDTIAEALEDFLGEDGYRLSFTDENGRTLTIRRSEFLAVRDGGLEADASISFG